MKKRQTRKFYKHSDSGVVCIKQTVILHEKFQYLLFGGKKLKRRFSISSRKPVYHGVIRKLQLISPHVSVFVYKQLVETLPRITFKRIR